MKRGKLFILAASFAFALSITNANADKTEVKYTLTPETQQEVDNIINLAKTDRMSAGSEFFNFIEDKKYKKELKKKEALTLAGQQFFKAGLYEQAAEMGRLAYETDGGYYPATMLYADALYEMKKYGDASALYEAAMNEEPNEKSSYMKTADVYKYINADHSLEVLEQFKKKFPNDPDVNKAMGDIYYYENKIDDAVKAYDTYFAEFKGTDVEAEEKYAIILFAKKNFQACYDKVCAALPKEPNRLGLNRMKFYTQMELISAAEENTGVAPADKIQEAKATSDKFFTMFVDTLYNGIDYKYQGQLADYLKDTPMMVSSYEHAAKIDPENAAIQKGLSDAYQKLGDADKAAAAYQKYMDITSPDKKSPQDILKKGKIYYSCAAAIEDPAKADIKKKYVEEGDKVFAELEEMAKDSYLGPMWRARILSMLDPENPIEAAKENYDKCYERLASKDDSYNTERKECLVYDAFYYFKKDNYAQAKDYCKKVLALDPNHSLAKTILNALGGK